MPDASVARKVMNAVAIGAICVFAFLMAMFAVPAIAEATGIGSDIVSFGLAGAAVLVLLLATRRS